MSLEALDVESITPYDGWPYEWVVGTARFAVDPAHPANARIADLDLAPADDDGRVRFEADLRLLRPTGEGNRRLLFVVANRGLVGDLPFSLGVPFTWEPAGPPQAGDGFLLEQGWTIAWCGWQWDVHRGEGGIGLTAPWAQVEPGPLRVEFRPDAVLEEHDLSDSMLVFRFADLPTADVGDPDAVLTVRTTPMGPREVVPRDRWRFTDATHVAVDGGFQPFHWYELVYRSAHAPVVGSGLLAIRDVVSHLRADFDHALAYGVSQSGRVLRQLLFEGLNVDEGGAPVFDGVLAHIAGARRGEFNHRYAQPSLTHPMTPSYGPPYDTAGLLARQRGVGGLPKLLLTNSAWEYWRGDGALVHQDAVTGDDLPDDPDARCHLLAGTDHLGSYPIKDTLPTANPVHHLEAGPVLRALFVQLDAWACDGVEPEPSQVPRRTDGTAVERAEVLAAFDEVALPDLDALPYTPHIDPDDMTWPVPLGEPRVALVSAVDEGGNEVAGIRLPAVAAPAAAHTGWNPRVHVDGLPDVLYEFAGSRLPLQGGRTPASEAEVRAAAADLVARRFLLERDVERVVAGALTGD